MNENNEKNYIIDQEYFFEHLHSMRNDLYSVNLGIISLKNQLPDDMCENTKKDLEMVYVGLERLTNRVKMVLANTNSDSPISSHKGKIYISEIISKSIKMHEWLTKKLKIKIIYHPSEEILIENIDIMKMSDALNNLIVNAIDYNIEGGKILIKCYKEDSDIIILLADNGIGYNTNKEKYLKPDSKIKICKSKESNNIGVEISRKIIEKHGGKLVIISPVEKLNLSELELDTIRIGTALFIHLPIK